MTDVALNPLRFDPIFQYRLWGGRRLEEWLDTKLSGNGPIGKAWLLSDRHDFPSRVADGQLKDQAISQLIKRSPDLVLGVLSSRHRKFPLSIKLLDVQKSSPCKSIRPTTGQTLLQHVRPEKPKRGSSWKRSRVEVGRDFNKGGRSNR